MILVPAPMKMVLAVASGGSLLVGQADGANDAYLHAKDLTVSGVLLAAVVFLYRELDRLRKADAEARVEQQKFVVAQTESIQRATDAQRVALEHVGTALASLTIAAGEQSETYKRHIDALVKTASKG